MKKVKGEYDYDYKNDILFFKVKDREYEKSVELDDVLLDIDKEGIICGIQIFEASRLFKLEKEALRGIQRWEFSVKIENNIVNIQLVFEVLRRNKIIERGQSLIREATLNDSEVVCEA